MMDRNRTIQLHKTLNCIREENSKMTIQRNKYFMLKGLFHTATKCAKNMDPIEVIELLVAPEYKSDTEMFDENTDSD